MSFFESTNQRLESGGGLHYVGGGLICVLSLFLGVCFLLSVLLVLVFCSVSFFCFRLPCWGFCFFGFCSVLVPLLWARCFAGAAAWWWVFCAHCFSLVVLGWLFGLFNRFSCSKKRIMQIQVPPGRRLNTHTSSVSQTHNWSISTLEQNEALPDSIHSAPSEQRPKRKRGSCRGLKTSAIVEGTGKIQIYVCPETGRVDNSANSSLLSHEYGYLVKRRLRHLMYMHYQKFPSLEEAKLHPHDYATKNDWEWLCDNIFSNEEFQDQMKVIEEEQKELPMEEHLIDKAICQQVLGKKSGYVRGLGYGPKPTPVHSKDITTETHRLETIVTTQAVEIEEQKKQIEEQKKQIEEQEKELGDMKARMTEFESMMRLLMSQSGSSQATQATFSQLP
ncbi:hypothetical protein Q3G72_018342 [Acer saccharum]|nr:hypothetical protein Q3G72_018342 [Acer saccharum]